MLTDCLFDNLPCDGGEIAVFGHGVSMIAPNAGTFNPCQFQTDPLPLFRRCNSVFEVHHLTRLQEAAPFFGLRLVADPVTVCAERRLVGM